MFPSYHPKKGQRTMFVEKVCTWLSYDALGYISPTIIPKLHTIRAGNRWRVGDKFSPRFWEGLPRRSKSIIMSADIEIKKIWHIEFIPTYMIYINETFYCSVGSERFDELAMNDGLNREDFRDWFVCNPKFKKEKGFSGQIICWSDNVNYL